MSSISDFYFDELNQTLKRHGTGSPMLVLDGDRLDQNLAQVQSMIPDAAQRRIVIKSLPSLELIRETSSKLETQNFMVFHADHLNLIQTHFERAHILMGKPMPIQAVRHFYEAHGLVAAKALPINWLVDTPERVRQLGDFATEQGLALNVNIEINIGLYRGGVDSLALMEQMLSVLAQYKPVLTLSGLMGYDAQVGKVPAWLINPQTSFQNSQDKYQAFIDCVRQSTLDFCQTEHLVLNGAGSPTVALHHAQSVCNDFSFGSMLVKPSDFELPTLNAFEACMFIATPILKRLDKAVIPEVTALSWLYRGKLALFVYGGYWKANYIYPTGAQNNATYGRSSNQEMVNVPRSCTYGVDDYVFLQPTQSEAVISQFREVHVIRKGQITQTWATFL